MKSDKPKIIPSITFDLPKEQASIIKVIGVGGGGSNAVNHMYHQGIRGVNFVICNTDSQAMELSGIPNKIQLGPSLTSGLGAGSDPGVGRKSAEESIEEIRSILEKNTKMVFITAGMGGGTGTGGAPVIARLAKEMGILTVGIVTTPFLFEGRRKMTQAKDGIDEMRQSVDSIIVISNDKIREIYGNLTKSDAFARADNILAIAARSISEIITVPGQINVDFADVRYVMKDSGVAIMGSSLAEGKDRAIRVIQDALASPLLNDSNIRGAQKILLNITSGKEQEVTVDEINEIHEYVLESSGHDTDVIFGVCDDEGLGDKVSVTVIATGFEEKGISTETPFDRKVVLNLDDKRKPLRTEKKEDATSLFDNTFTFDFQGKPATGKTDESKPVDTAADENPVNENIQQASENVKPGEAPREDSFIISRKTEEPPVARNEPNAQQLDRAKRLADINRGFRSPNGLSELENEPAYKRKNIQLSSTPHSSESAMSRYSLGSEQDEGALIKKNNSFLHDNVD